MEIINVAILQEKQIALDKISYLTNKDQIICANIDASKYYPKLEGTKTYYHKCKYAMTDWEECSDESHWTKCIENFATADNIENACVNILNNYYYDRELGTYKLCSYKFNHCENCLFNDYFIYSNCPSGYAFKT